MPPLAKLIDHLERLAPLSQAADWDNVGLLLGDRHADVSGVLTCLTVTPAVAAEAVARKVQLIVTHHPILFRGVKRLTTASAEGRLVLALVQAGVAVYSAHSAFDDARGGINDRLARRLGLSAVTPLRPAEGAGQVKIVVFVPPSDLERVAAAMFEAGAGQIGQYRECSFRLAGTGTFFGGAGTNPTVGQAGRREEVSEWRLEVLCPDAALDRVLGAMRRIHSYEEPAYDVYPLWPAPSGVGAGRVGDLAEPLPLTELAKQTREQLRCGPVQVVGDPKRSVRRVAIACGAAGEFLADAERAGADVFLTGEMRFHDYLAAQQKNIALCLPGHYATERFAQEELAEHLRTVFEGVEVFASAAETDPVSWV